MADLQLTRTGDVHIRVQDYLDDQIQTAADLEQVDNLLVRVQEQQDLLRKQVRSLGLPVASSPDSCGLASKCTRKSARCPIPG